MAGWVILVPMMPWLGALTIVLGMSTGPLRGEAGERITARIALVAVGCSLLGMLWLDGMMWRHTLVDNQIHWPWLTSGYFQVTIRLMLDRAALVMGSLVAVTAFLTLRFSVNYLHREPGYHRFFAIMCLFTGGMELIALSGNAVLTFIGWEAAGLSSYLLIAYAYDRVTATQNATRAFVTNRFGDAGFIFGMAMAFAFTGSLDWSQIFEKCRHINSLLVGITVAGFLLAAVVKSAQLPFVAWINRALEGPTPSSALFYGALMAHAGAFLVIRLEPLLWISPFLMVLLFITGITTFLYASVVGWVQSDVKSVLLFSTQAQIGLIFAECGLGYFELALWHLVVHTLWRLYQFLLSPSYIHLAEGVARPIPAWLSRYRTLYNFALHRFWFDSMTDALFTRPTLALGREVQIFDEKVVSRMAGRPIQEALLASQGHWNDPNAPSQGSSDTQGRGMLGRLLEMTAKWFSWFEDHLVLNSSGDGLLHAMTFLGGYVMRIEQLLGHPRYLYLLLALTFMVIL